MSCEYKYYSVILKGCSRRENLGHRLEKTLLRGRLAIKMALDNMPSVIIYKGIADTIIPVVNAFKAEYAAITILSDGVPPALPLTKKYRDFPNIEPELQDLLTHAPDNLWLGEAIHRIVPARFLDETGALVISSHAIYFIDKPAGDQQCRWLIIPYGQITDSPTAIAAQSGSLVISYQDAAGWQQDSFILKPELIASIKAAIEQAKHAQRYRTRLKTVCPGCGRIFEGYLDNTPTETDCPKCGQPYQRTIIA